MLYLNYSFVCVLIGIGLVTIIDIVGSIVSRKLNFNYGYFGLLSLFAYTYIGFLIMEKTNYMTITMLSVMLVGVYDGIVGWKISQKLRANYGQSKELTDKMTVAYRIFAGIIFSIVCGWLGIYLANQ